MENDISQEEILKNAKTWWTQLNPTWKQAFNEVAKQRSTTEDIEDDLLVTIYTAENHRFSGPSAPYPNMTFELDEMSGVVGLPLIKLLVIAFHQLKDIQAISAMKTLTSVFLFNNQITSLDGIEALTDLKELYVMSNQITSLKPLENLTKIKTLYCVNNQFSSLEGIGTQHLDCLEQFHVLPNPNLKQSTVFAFEQSVGIRCIKG